jgi:hypothetical protein
MVIDRTCRSSWSEQRAVGQRCLFVRLIHKFLRSWPDRTASAGPVFPCLVDAAPAVLIGSFEDIEIGVRNYVMVVAFDCHAGLPSSCGAAFRSARSHSFAQPGNPLSACSRARREGRRRLAADFFSIAPWHVGIGYTETVIIRSFFALLARHVPAMMFPCAHMIAIQRSQALLC